jgi:uncharacterized protein (TIGR00251 family)
MRVTVHVKPRSSRSLVLGVKDGRLEVALHAPPVDGAANAELLRLLAVHFGVAKRSVRLVSGESSRTKIVEISTE